MAVDIPIYVTGVTTPSSGFDGIKRVSFDRQYSRFRAVGDNTLAFYAGRETDVSGTVEVEDATTAQALSGTKTASVVMTIQKHGGAGTLTFANMVFGGWRHNLDDGTSDADVPAFALDYKADSFTIA